MHMRVVIGFDGEDVSFGAVGGTVSTYLNKLPDLSVFTQANLGSRYSGIVETAYLITDIQILDESPTPSRLQELSAL
ncbi:MAG: hypothetical protein COA43_01395 [Robiginitomaculum sp.]|nr:MAG: hypothetical protein COA43_01395 [Robiginitomaculum sp.]